MKQTLWTIQHIDAYENMKKTGVLHANEQVLFCQDDMGYVAIEESGVLHGEVEDKGI